MTRKGAESFGEVSHGTEIKPMDYLAMQDHGIIEECRDDAAKWAAAFCQYAKHLGYGDIDEGWMIGWFANAIETADTVRRERGSGGGDEFSL